MVYTSKYYKFFVAFSMHQVYEYLAEKVNLYIIFRSLSKALPLEQLKGTNLLNKVGDYCRIK